MASRSNIWRTVLSQPSPSLPDMINFEAMEELFCQKPTVSPVRVLTENKKILKEPTVISLLDGKRSLNISICLKQFKMSPQEIVTSLRNCDGAKLGSEKLRMLLKILPQPDEAKLLKSYTGKPERLALPEKFFLQLSSLKHYPLYINGLLQMEEFQPIAADLILTLDKYIGLVTAIMKSERLRKFFLIILTAGNFINAGSYAGNASGFRLNTLAQLIDIRSNKPRMTLLHYLVEAAESNDQEALFFTQEFEHLTACSRVSLDTTKADIIQLKAQIAKLEKNYVSAEDNLKKHLLPFIQSAKKQLKSLHMRLDKIEELSKELASFFCEDETKFSVEECLQLINTFCEKVKVASKENVERKITEERAARIRKAKEQEFRDKSSLSVHVKSVKVTPGSRIELRSEHSHRVDRLLEQIRMGSFKLKSTTNVK